MIQKVEAVGSNGITYGFAFELETDAIYKIRKEASDYTGGAVRKGSALYYVMDAVRSLMQIQELAVNDCSIILYDEEQDYGA